MLSVENMLNTLLWGFTCSAQHNRHTPWSFDRQPHVRGQSVSATPHDSRPVKHYVTCTGAPATDIASIGAETCLFFRPNRFTPRSADPGNMIGQPERVYKHAERWDNRIIIYTTTQRDVYILNFAVTLHTLQLDAHTVVPFLYGPPHHRPPGLYGHIFIAIAFSITNYLSPVATRLTQPMVRVGWRIFHSSANRSSNTAIFNHKSKTNYVGLPYTFVVLCKYNIHGIVAMLDVSNVDNVRCA